MDIKQLYGGQMLSQENINKLLDSIIKTSQDGLYVCDHDGNALLINDALINVTNISADVFYSHTLHELIKHGILPRSSAYRTLQTRKKEDMIIEYYHGKKAVLTSTPVFDNKGEIFCIISNVRDITELENLHRKLEETNRLKSEYEELLFTNNKLFVNEETSFVHKSVEMEKVISLSAKLAKADSPILILGESGSGKDVLARYIHEKSRRSGKFVKINCAAIPADLIESELFGYDRGAFTGAHTSKKGLFELSHEGTIFLDEIGEMPLELQAKLLSIIEDKKVRRIGGTKSFPIDLRIIAATNVNLAKRVKENRFRTDLYYRLNVLPITIPPLRERKSDIPILTLFFLHQLNKRYYETKKLDPLIIDHFLEYAWPGNIRELNNIVERMYHMSESNHISVEYIPAVIKDNIVQKHPQERFYDANVALTDFASKTFHKDIDDVLPLKEVVKYVEKQYIEQVTTRRQTLQESADALQISLSTLMRKRRKYKLT